MKNDNKKNTVKIINRLIIKYKKFILPIIYPKRTFHSFYYFHSQKHRHYGA